MGSDNPRPGVRSAGTNPDGAPRRVFVVAGMHRAGTSVVARGLQALGVDLGDRLMSADQRVNARGFFEDNDIVKLDDALLEASGADWKNLALLDAIDWGGSKFAAARIEAEELLEKRLARSGQFGFKDPRIARLIPFWQGVFAQLGVSDAYVIAVRHPLSVIDSLTARDDLPVQRSGWLWLTHLVCALHYTKGRTRVVVDYDRLLSAPERELARMATGLALAAPVPGSAEIKSYCEGFLSKGLRHAEHATGAPIPASLPRLLLDAHALVQRLAADEADQGSGATNVEIDALFERLVELSPFLAYAGATERSADCVPQLRGELEWARTSLEEASKHNGSLRAAIEESARGLLDAQRSAESLQSALDRKDEALATAQSYSDDLRATLGRKDEALAVAQTYSDDLQATLRRKNEALASAQAYNDDLQATLRRKDEALVSAQAYNDDLRATLGRKDEALAVAQAYNDDLHAAIGRKDEALATAKAYVDDLQATVRRKDIELSAAQGAIERIRQRLVGRMLLRRIERTRDSG